MLLLLLLPVDADCVLNGAEKQATITNPPLRRTITQNSAIQLCE